MKTKFKIFAVLIPLVIILSGCNANGNHQPQQNFQPKEQMFYKTIDVRVTGIKTIWQDPRLTKWAITVKSDEYGMENTVEQFYSTGSCSCYGVELYNGQIKEGSWLKAELLTWKTGDTINRRDINQLIR